MSSTAKPRRDFVRALRARTKGVHSFYKEMRPKKLSVKDQAFFAKRLSFLIAAGVPILEALTMLREQGRSKEYAEVISGIIDDIANGQNLSKSLAKYPDMFGEFAINIIKVGETSGILSKNLDYLADELKKKQALQRKIIGAFIYPVLITCATLAITAFLTVYLFPKIMPIFLSLHVHLPFSTRLVIWLSSFLRHWGILLLLGVAALVLAFVVAKKRSARFRRWLDGSLLALPIVGMMARSYNIANATRTLGLLLKSELTLSSALSVVAETTHNAIYKEAFETLGTSVARGQQISQDLKSRGDLFPAIVGQMVSVGERSGNLSNSLIYLSEFYEHEVEDFTKDLSSLIEPVLMIFMGLLIGFIAVSIITPIYAITQNLQP